MAGCQLGAHGESRRRTFRRFPGKAFALVACVLAVSACGTLESHSRIVDSAGGNRTQGAPSGAGDTVGGGSTSDSQTGGSLGAAPGTGAGSPASQSGSLTGTASGAGISGGGVGSNAGGTGSQVGVAQDHSPIVIGSVGNYSGITGGAEAPGVVALEAWSSWENAHGGVNGHPIKLYVRDDQSDPGQNLADTQALVQQQHIVAEVSVWASQTQQASAGYLQQNGIPVVGGDGTGQDSWGVRPNFFPEGDIGNTLVEDGPAAGAKVLFPQGKKKLAILVCQEAAVCSTAASVDGSYAPTIGWNVVYNQSASFAAPSYTAQCLAMKSAQADAVVLVMPSSATLNVAHSCDQQGYDPAYLIGYGVTEGNFNSDPALRNAIVFASAFPFAGAPPTSAVTEYEQAMKQYEPNQILDPATAAGWAAAKMFQAAVERMSGPVTAAKITAALITFTNSNFGGLTIPLNLSNPPVKPQQCWFLMLINNGNWVAPNGNSSQCQ